MRAATYMLVLVIAAALAAPFQHAVMAEEAVPDFVVQSIRFLNTAGEPISYVSPGMEFVAVMDFRSSDLGVSDAFAQMILSSDGVPLASGGRRVELVDGRGELRLTFQAPPAGSRLRIDAAANSGLPTASTASTAILMGRALTRYEPQRLLVRAPREVEMFFGQRYPINEHVLIYQHFHGVYRGVERISYHDLMVGAHDVVLSTLQGEVVQIDVLAPQYVETVRVGLGDANFSSVHHKDITLSSSTGLRIENARGHVLLRISPGLPLEFGVAGGEVVIKRNGEVALRSSDRLFISAADGGMIRIDSFQRGGSQPFHPEYRGLFEIAPSGSETFLIINELPIDEYLYGVLPSEMPASWHSEALKAQAVIARTYAVAQAQSSSFSSHGFHLDDSSSSQVYNNQRETGKSNAAVDSTTSLILRSTADEAIIQGAYHSASGGTTARASQTWSSQHGEFPGVDYPYLQARSLVPTVQLPEHWTEDAAVAFFQDRSLTGYDSASPWFRWQFTLSGEELTRTINRNLAERWRAQPEFVLTRDAEGRFVSKPIPAEGIGTIRHLEVVQRGDGGGVMALDIYSDSTVVRVLKEFNIRFTIRPAAAFTGSDITLERSGAGTNLVNYSLLPSAFFSFEQRHDGSGGLASVTFFGGGSGHGVGMSQWAAKSMAEEGMNFERILTGFFPGTRLAPLHMEYHQQ